LQITYPIEVTLTDDNEEPLSKTYSFSLSVAPNPNPVNETATNDTQTEDIPTTNSTNSTNSTTSSNSTNSDSNSTQGNDTVEEYYDPDTIFADAEIATITRDGVVRVTFSEKIKIPPNYN
jgi:hypothetical protein